MFDTGMMELLTEGILNTLYMTVVSTCMAYAIGLPLGVILCVTDKDGVYPVPTVNKILGFIINLIRSVPFLILLVFIMPFTRAIVGTTIGTTGTIVPLVVSAFPFVARVVESSLKEVDGGVIEAAQSMGSSTFQIIYKVLIPEAKPSLIIGAAISITTILGYSAMAGFVGGGGLGKIAINYGYYRYQRDIMAISVLFLVIIVQIFQEIGMRVARLTDKRIK
ncbi:MAG: ABC transporter permease [Clostridiaceae bacterium]|jgi:D-methionine transport system permease protein|nr:ABC transporter permease [Clostridiaceae bacterium]